MQLYRIQFVIKIQNVGQFAVFYMNGNILG